MAGRFRWNSALQNRKNVYNDSRTHCARLFYAIGRMRKMTRKEKAIELHNRGFNCAQAVAGTFAEALGVPEEVMFAACEGFGLGMGGMEATCGAVSGAVMAAGFKNSCATPENPTTKAATYQYARAITRAFAEKNGTLICKELKGIETGRMLRSCSDCITDAVEIAEQVLGL